MTLAMMTHTQMAFHFINPYKPLGFRYETCLQDSTYIDSYTQNKHIHTHFKILKIKYYITHQYTVS